MKKILMSIGVLAILCVGVVACGNDDKQEDSQKKISLTVENEDLQTDSSKTATIKGKTEPFADIQVEGRFTSGDEKKNTQADKEGNFSQTVDWQTNYKVVAEKDGVKSNTVTVKVTHPQ
ncbi:hypothetical protein [Listeria newyorkensis]|uniref:Lipoprotein n=1 Tax=Listeria newyorkensis TaxID=1497681 RepID=A0A841Z0L7_9LIST|nr:hypothetical protein [Listeria newyorkensis]MBC1459128.1 hypothetical protein [Listeria newyorkensis]